MNEELWRLIDGEIINKCLSKLIVCDLLFWKCKVIYERFQLSYGQKLEENILDVRIFFQVFKLMDCNYESEDIQ